MSAPDAEPVAFGKLRGFFWPVHRHELKKLLPMLFIFFLITFNYNVLRTMKDTLVITAPSSGAEALPFIKVWFMFPGAVLMTILFTRLANRFKQEYVFYSLISIFLAYFILFIFVLFPNNDILHPHDICDKLQVMLPDGFKWIIAAFRNWTFTIFYVMSELWSNIILSLLMWGFVNQVTNLGDARRFYAIFGVGINFSGIIAGWLSVQLCLSAFNPNLPFGTTAWEQTLYLLLGTVILVGFAIMGLFRWLNTVVLTDPRYYDPESARNEKNIRGRVSMRDSFRYLLKSRYLINLSIIVITYNIVINVVEVVWKHEMKELYPNQQDYQLYNSYVTMIMGCLATFTSMFIAGNSVRKFGWSFTAMLTPVILAVTSVLFFGSFFAKQYWPEMLVGLFGVAPLTVVVFFGTVQNVLSRAAKYTVFDETREMALIPLSSESKLKGKAVIDGVCSRLGKSGGSIAHQSLILSFASITESMPFLSVFLVLIIGLWGSATWVAGKDFNRLISKENEPDEKSNESKEGELAEQIA